MDYKIHLGHHVRKYLKKLKEKPLQQKFVNAIYDEIAKDPYAFNSKTGDLSGYYTYDFKYKGTEYRIAYSIDYNKLLIVIILTGSHENFYKELKRANPMSELTHFYCLNLFSFTLMLFL